MEQASRTVTSLISLMLFHTAVVHFYVRHLAYNDLMQGCTEEATAATRKGWVGWHCSEHYI